MIKEQMDVIVEHILSQSSGKTKVKEFVCHFKFRGPDEFYLLYCDQLRNFSVSFFDQGSPKITLSSNCRVDWVAQTVT